MNSLSNFSLALLSNWALRGNLVELHSHLLLLVKGGLELANKGFFEHFQLLVVEFKILCFVVFFRNSSFVKSGSRVKILVHVVSENTFGSLRIILDLLILHLVIFKSLFLVLVYHFIKLLSLHFNMVNLGSISLVHIRMTLINIILKTRSSVVEFGARGIFDPFAVDIHRINHVKFLTLKLVNFVHEILLSGEILDSLVGELFFFLQFQNSGL